MTIDNIFFIYFLKFLVIFIFVVVILVQFYVILVRNGMFYKKQILKVGYHFYYVIDTVYIYS